MQQSLRYFSSNLCIGPPTGRHSPPCSHDILRHVATLDHEPSDHLSLKSIQVHVGRVQPPFPSETAHIMVI